MHFLDNFEELKKYTNKSVVTIGNFDGVHKGHLVLIKEAEKWGKQNQAKSVIFTFDPHPLKVLKSKDLSLITLQEDKKKLLSANNIDILFCQKFTKDFASITAKDFVEKILIDKFKTKCIVVGDDYTFGKNRSGDVDFLKKYKDSFELIIPKWVEIKTNQHQERVSSTTIRKLIIEGKVKKAAIFLGRDFSIRGIVEKGKNLGGAKLGFKTANLYTKNELIPKDGVYIAWTKYEKKYPSLVNIGKTPTIPSNKKTIEAHILNFDKNIYDEEIEIEFLEKIRDERKFESIDELKSQIKKDIKVAKEFFEQKVF